MLLKRITQQELSKRTGIPQSDISKIVNDEKEIWLLTAFKIADAVGCTVDHLWGYKYRKR
ncbi:helix-turn-helix domain-containing protein [Desulfosporosinus fructosivorans]